MKKTRVELAAENDRLNRENILQAICLNAALQGAVKWFRRGVYRVGVVRPTWASGGYVIVEFAPGGQMPSANTYLADEFFHWQIDGAIPADSDREGNDLRTLAIMARSYAHAEQDREWRAEASAIAPAA